MPPRGKKFSKPSRGGGKHFSRDVQPTDKHGNPVGLWRDPADEIPSSSGDEEDEEEETTTSGSSSEEEDNATKAGESSSAAAGPGAERTREERRAAARAKKASAIAKRQAAQPGDMPPSSSSEEDEDEGSGGLPANPNHTAKARSQTQKDPMEKETKSAKDLSQLTRREREAIEAQQERERYMKLHAEGKTEEARSDLARLAIIREKREAERARKEAEKEERADRAAEREKEIKAREASTGKKKGGSKKK